MQWKQFFTPVTGMDPEEVRTYLRNHREGTYTLLDVRQPGEYEKEHIPGALLIPLPDLASRLPELDREKPIIAY
jgi:sulfur-carrier protein adenylyltransferase/sulfurtransferase